MDQKSWEMHQAIYKAKSVPMERKLPTKVNIGDGLVIIQIQLASAALCMVGIIKLKAVSRDGVQRWLK